MRAMGGAVKSPSRCSSKLHRIFAKFGRYGATAIATEISKTISSTKSSACSLPANAHWLPDQGYRTLSLHGGFYKRSRSRRAPDQVATQKSSRGEPLRLIVSSVSLIRPVSIEAILAKGT